MVALKIPLQEIFFRLGENKRVLSAYIIEVTFWGKNRKC